MTKRYNSANYSWTSKIQTNDGAQWTSLRRFYARSRTSLDQLKDGLIASSLDRRAKAQGVLRLAIDIALIESGQQRGSWAVDGRRIWVFID